MDYPDKKPIKESVTSIDQKLTQQEIQPESTKATPEVISSSLGELSEETRNTNKSIKSLVTVIEDKTKTDNIESHKDRDSREEDRSLFKRAFDVIDRQLSIKSSSSSLINEATGAVETHAVSSFGASLLGPFGALLGPILEKEGIGIKDAYSGLKNLVQNTSTFIKKMSDKQDKNDVVIDEPVSNTQSSTNQINVLKEPTKTIEDSSSDKESKEKSNLILDNIHTDINKQTSVIFESIKTNKEIQDKIVINEKESSAKLQNIIEELKDSKKVLSDKITGVKHSVNRVWERLMMNSIFQFLTSPVGLASMAILGASALMPFIYDKVKEWSSNITGQISKTIDEKVDSIKQGFKDAVKDLNPFKDRKSESKQDKIIEKRSTESSQSSTSNKKSSLPSTQIPSVPSAKSPPSASLIAPVPTPAPIIPEIKDTIDYNKLASIMASNNKANTTYTSPQADNTRPQLSPTAMPTRPDDLGLNLANAGVLV